MSQIWILTPTTAYFTLYLVPLPKLPDYSVSAEHMTERIEAIQAEVKKNIEASNAKYKADADKRRREKVYSVGDLVMVHLCNERFPVSTYSKLHPRKIGLCKVLRKINDNAYVVDLSEGWNISLTFNVADLVDFYPDNPLYIEADSGTNPFQVGERE